MIATDSSAFLRQLRDELDEAGMTGSFLVREISSGAELGFDTDMPFPLASLVKIPLALSILERIDRGEMAATDRLTIAPDASASARASSGIVDFRHPVELSIDDALTLAVSVSHNPTADALFGLVSPATVQEDLDRWGCDGLRVRHDCSGMRRTPSENLPEEDIRLAHSLAISETTPGGGHQVPQLDTTRTSSGTARGLVRLLCAIWGTPEPPSARHPEGSTFSWGTRSRIRELMSANVHRQRLTPDFASDATHWASKTGTLLNVRSEIGVVEHSDGEIYVVAALSQSTVRASIQPNAEAVMGDVARRLRDRLRAL